MPWEIQQSTLPWREGHHLDFADLLTISDDGTALVPRAVGDEQWTIPVNTLSSRNIKTLFGKPVGAAGEVNTKNPLIGTWLLVKYVDTPSNGEPIFAFGKEPVGHFTFTAGGHLAFSIMRNPPDTASPTSDPDPDARVPGWYCANFGTYTLDTKSGVWVTHVLGSDTLEVAIVKCL
jgi:Lipocalin-like domain